MKREAPALAAGVDRLLALRTGAHWEGEVVWNPMLAAQYAIAMHVMARPLSPERGERLITQLRAMQLEDGCWGMHLYGEASLFVTALCYVAARTVGVSADDPLLAGARAMFTREDVLAIPSWGKIWLSLEGLYEWDGVNAVPPEAWLLPERMPLHPANYYCHTRLIYMGMASVRALRITAPPSPLRDALRVELYPGRDYASLDFRGARNRLREADLWAPPGRLLRGLYAAVNVFERVHSTRLRARLLARFRERIRFELRSSDYTCLSPVNGLLFALTLHAHDPGDPDLERQLARFVAPDEDAADTNATQATGWVWEDDVEGLRVTGARSATWDTAFALQALSIARASLPSNAGRARLDDALVAGLRWLETQQIEAPPTADAATYRANDRVDPTGGFCFAGVWHGWPVSDCTAEAICAFLEAPRDLYAVDAARIEAGVRFMLQAQNFDGGFGSYEARKSRVGLEWMNPAEMFGDSMTELSYYECTASNLLALCAVRERFPGMLRARIDESIRRAETYLRASQNEDGSWDGAWGVAYLYGTLFGVRGLIAAGASTNDPAIERARNFVRVRQRPDGAWSESWRSCLEDRFVDGDDAHPTQTAWALMTLLEGDAAPDESVARGVEALASMQRGGDWDSPMMSGVFFRTALLDYRLYRRFFPVWALALHEKTRVRNTVTPTPLRPNAPRIP